MQGKTQGDDAVLSLVELALLVPEGEREAYVREACGGDEARFRRVWEYVQIECRMKESLEDTLPGNARHEHPFEPGDVLDGRFQIVREIAQGGMGIVYEAMDRKLDRRIALKCAKPGFQQRLYPEARNASDITHVNVCKIFEIHTTQTDAGEIDFITMEFLDVETLSQKLSRGISKPEAYAIAQQVCSGLAEAHRNRVIHGDLKSSNVILCTGADGTMRAVITDFGLARRPDSPHRSIFASAKGGTPAYMAPELWKGAKPSMSSDVYALGVMLVELLAGHLPQRLTTTEVGSTQSQPLQKPSGLKRKWDRVIERCLDSNPAARFHDGSEVSRALFPSRYRRLFMAAVVAAIVLAIVSSFITYESAKAPSESVRLAVLPFEGDAATKPLSEGLLLDAGNRLTHVKSGRVRLTIVPLTDAVQNRVTEPAQARTMLGATHVLSGTLRRENGRVVLNAYLSDARSLVHLAEWRAEYSESELQNMPMALAGMVTGALKLSPLSSAATVNAAAYADFTAGISLARRDTDLDRALPLLERAAAADPNSPLTYAALADAQFSKYLATNERQWKDRAWINLKKAEQRNPDIAAVRFVAGTLYDDDGQYEQAEADFQRAIDLEPANGDAWRQLAKTYEHDNQPNRALAAYLKAIEVQPEYFKNYKMLGEFHFTRGEYDEAVTQYKKVIELVPDLAIAHYQLATPYLNLGRYDEAERELRIALRIEETSYEVEGFGLLRMYQNQDREAIPYLERALEIGPKSSLFYLNLGTAYRRAGLPAEAKQAYRNGLDLSEARLSENPRDAYEKSCLAYLCARLGDRRRAEAEIAQALQLARGANNVRWMGALTYEALGLHEQTIAAIEDAPDWFLARLNRFPDVTDLRASPRFQELLQSHHIK